MRNLIAALCILSFMMMNAYCADLPPEQNRIQSGHLPTPFSAAELKAYNVPGYATTYRIEVEGKETIQHATRWLQTESGKASYVTQIINEAGVPVGDLKSAEATWAELQSHASFPASATTIKTETVEVPVGSFTCWRYDVTRSVPVQDGPPKTLVMTFWFAKDMPGPPVLMKHTVDGELKLTMTLVKAERPESAPAAEE